MKKGKISKKDKPKRDSNTRKKQKMSFLSPAILVIVAGFVMFAYFLPRQTKQNSYETTTPTTSSPQTSTTIKPEAYIKLSGAWSLGMKRFSDPKLSISFEYPSYFDVKVTDIDLENKKWAENKYARQPFPKNFLFNAKFSTPNTGTMINCPEQMYFIVDEFDNPNLSVFDFIQNEIKSEPSSVDADSRFNEFKKKLFSTNLPKTGSYIYIGDYNDSYVKWVYFENNGKTFKFTLTNACTKYTKDADNIFDKILKSINYL